MFTDVPRTAVTNAVTIAFVGKIRRKRVFSHRVVAQTLRVSLGRTKGVGDRLNMGRVM